MTRTIIPLALLAFPILPGCDLLLDDGKDSGVGTDTAAPGDDDDTTVPGDDDDDTTGAQRGWTLVPLLDDTSGDFAIWHSGSDLVTGIHFTDLQHGVVVTTGANQTFADGGAVFSARERELTGILVNGSTAAQCMLGVVDFTGVVATADGYVAMAEACDWIHSDDGGASFRVDPMGVGDPFGIEDLLAYRETGSGTVLVRDTGVVSRTGGAPGANAIWDDVYAPQGVPPTPNPVPPDLCQVGPQSNNVPSVASAVYVADDGQFLAYGSAEPDGPAICVSRDGGTTVRPHRLRGISEDVTWAAPTGVLFPTPDIGIAWYATNIYPDATYLRRSVDAGETWDEVPLPSDLVGTAIELREAFFAPGGQVGFLVGYDYDHGISLLLKTDDAGASWRRSGGDLAQIVSGAGGGKLWTGFALDERHIWVGGEWGVLAASDAGGE
ncbi:MAG: hypothetical protein R3F59_24325 [Myxococcota bacterium]